MNDNVISYHQLDPETIIQAVESVGLQCDGRITALNSYENRVYQIGIEDKEPIIGKFYRPNRWSDETIQEEHGFSLELQDNDISVVAPLVFSEQTLLHYSNFRFALYPRKGGYPPETDNPEQLEQLGRVIARMHNIGSTKQFFARDTIKPLENSQEASKFLLHNDFIPNDLLIAYESLCEQLFTQMQEFNSSLANSNFIRLHADFHHGNVLYRDEIAHVVDFDDARMGPAIQDIWMFLAGERHEMTQGLGIILDGYTEFRDFDAKEIVLIELLRTTRIITYAAWIAKRWQDPAFPLAFPYFNTQQYWEGHILALREQAALLQEEPLKWYP